MFFLTILHMAIGRRGSALSALCAALALTVAGAAANGADNAGDAAAPGVTCTARSNAGDLWIAGHQAYGGADFETALVCFTLAIPRLRSEFAKERAKAPTARNMDTLRFDDYAITDAHTYRALTLWHGGDTRGARSAFTTALKTYAHSRSSAPPSRGTRAWLRGDYKSAFARYREDFANDMQGDIAYAPLKLDVLRTGAQGKLSQAETHATRALAQYANSKDLRLVLGLLRLREYRVAEAQCQWLAGLEIDLPFPEGGDSNDGEAALDMMWLMSDTARRFGIQCREHALLPPVVDRPQGIPLALHVASTRDINDLQPRLLSPATRSISFVFDEREPPFIINIDLSSGGCRLDGDGLTCNASVPFPFGKHRYVMDVWDGRDGKGVVLAHAGGPYEMTGAPDVLDVSVHGVIGSISLVAPESLPILHSGQAADISILLVARDPDGYPILNEAEYASPVEIALDGAPGQTSVSTTEVRSSGKTIIVHYDGTPSGGFRLTARTAEGVTAVLSIRIP